MDATIQRLVASCRPGAPVTAGRLQVVPLTGPAGDGPAPEASWGLDPDEPLRLSERDDEARVEEVQAFNGTPRDILALDGELLAGGFQDRMLSTSVLMRRRSAVLLPTACSEEGRFEGSDPHFAPTGRVASPRYRRRLRLGRGSAIGGDGTAPRQRAVWDDIEADRLALGHPGDGVSLLSLRLQADDDCRSLAASLGSRSGDMGWMVFLDGHFMAGDLFAHGSLARQYGPPLLEAAAYDAVVEDLRDRPASTTSSGTERQIPSGDWDEMGSELDRALVMRQEIASGATRLCFDSPALTGTALLHTQGPLHLSFFPAVYAEDVLSLD